jgi:hypothetical protein
VGVDERSIAALAMSGLHVVSLDADPLDLPANGPGAVKSGGRTSSSPSRSLSVVAKPL